MTRSRIAAGSAMVAVLLIGWVVSRLERPNGPMAEHPTPERQLDSSDGRKRHSAPPKDRFRSLRSKAPAIPSAHRTESPNGDPSPSISSDTSRDSQLPDAAKNKNETITIFRTKDSDWESGLGFRIRADSDSTWREYPLQKAGTRLVLPVQTHEAVCIEKKKGAGELITFLPADEKIITLPTPERYRLEFQIIDYADNEPVPEVKVEVKSTARHNDLSKTQSSFSDELGLVQTSLIPSGATIITISKDGYESASFDIDLPGPWKNESHDGDVVDIGLTDIVKLTPIQVQLKSHVRSTELSNYRVSHTHTGVPVRSDPKGKVELQLGIFSTPLYLKIWYPDDHVSVRYLDGGMPPEGESHDIKVSTPARLEVNLSCSHEVEDLLEKGDFTIAASFKAQNGDAAKNTRDVDGAGVYTIHGIDVPTATVSLEQMSGDVPTTWAVASTTLPTSGIASVSIYIEAPPTVVELTDNAGTPLAGAFVELREFPDSTGWTAGALTNIRGEIKAPRCGNRSRLRVSWDSTDLGTCHAIGIPFDMSLADQRQTIRLGQIIHPRIEVFDETGPLENYSLMLGSIYSSAPHMVLRPAASGAIERFGLTSDSSATVTVSAEGMWFADQTLPLTGETVRFRGYQMGSMSLDQRLDLSNIVAEEFGTSLEAWRMSGQILVNTAPDGSRVANVPIGTYTVREGPGEACTPMEVVVGEVCQVSAR